METIINTWPEFSSLRADIASGKGKLVASQSQALESIQADEGVYFLADSESVKDIVFADYMRKKGPSEPLCSLTYTENFKLATYFSKSNLCPVLPRSQLDSSSRATLTTAFSCSTSSTRCCSGSLKLACWRGPSRGKAESST